MTKFLFQLFLSVLVSVGAVAGFSPGAKDKLAKTWNEAKGFVPKVSNALNKTAADLEAKVETSVETESEVEVGADLGRLFDKDKGSRKSPEVGADASLSAEAENEIQLELDNLDTELDSETELELGLEIER